MPRLERRPGTGNNGRPLSDNVGSRASELLNIPCRNRILARMSHRRLALALAATFAFATQAGAACFADYKAKRDAPLQLHYGVVQLPESACSRRAAADEIQRRIGADGWQLLTVVSVFDDSGLAEREQSAGPFFLRY